MLVTHVETYKVRYYEQPSLEEVLVECLPILTENTVVVIAPKLVSVCEGSIVYSGKSVRILTPSDPCYTAERVKNFLAEHYELANIGVLIDSSHCGFKQHAKDGMIKSAASLLAGPSQLAIITGISSQLFT